MISNEARKKSIGVLRITPKIKRAFHNIEVKKMSVNRGLIEAGYTPNTAKNGATITHTKAYLHLKEQFKDVLEECGVTPVTLAKTYSELVRSKSDDIRLKTSIHLEGHLGLNEKKKDYLDAPVQIMIVAPNQKPLT
jgi:hypothetical protein